MQKTFKKWYSSILFDNNNIISQSTQHFIGSVYMNTASHTFIIDTEEENVNSLEFAFHKTLNNDIPINLKSNAS